MRAKGFPLALRGYDRAAVDAWREEIAAMVEHLEQQAPRDTAVKRALDEVGQETAAILQHAHEAAEEIEARSRSQADGRLQRAEREAEEAIGEAEGRAARLEADTRAIWEQRMRLLDEVRQLADEILGVADDASDRIEPPGGREAEPEPELEVEEPVDGDPGTEELAEAKPDVDPQADSTARADAG